MNPYSIFFSYEKSSIYFANILYFILSTNWHSNNFCLWYITYTKCLAVFFCSILTISLHFPDEPFLLHLHLRCEKP